MSYIGEETSGSNNNSNGSNGWQEYKRLVLNQLETLLENGKVRDQKLADMKQSIEDLKRELSNTKITVGAIAGGIGFALSAFTQYIIPILRGVGH